MSARLHASRACGVTLTAAACLRCSTMVVPFPGWDIDPFTSFAPVLGFGPEATVLADALIVALAGAGLALSRLSGWWLVAVLAWLAGAAVAGVHGLVGPFGVDDARIGASWVAATGAGLAAAALAREVGTRRLMTGVLVGFVMVLAAQGAVQVLFEHPLTVSAYRADPAAVLEAQGIEPGSAAAAMYERRLFQAEATGWFGLSNVYGSVCAAAAAVLLVAAVSSWRSDRQRWVSVMFTVGGVLGLAATAASRSKGAVVALGAGLCAAGAWAWLSKPGQRRSRGGAPVVVPALVLAVLAAVAVRGAVGERSGELSLLFRSFYISTAADITAQHPVAGVGPAGFKDAYVLAKPPVSPEEVASPHSVLFDWSSTLGLGGMAWGVLLLAGAWRVGWGRVEDEDKDADSLAGWGRPMAVTIGLVAVASAAAEIEGLLPESALVRIVGVALWIAVAAAVIGATSEIPRAALVAGAAVLLAHAQIEMTLTTDGSAVWGLALVGIAAGAGLSDKGHAWVGRGSGAAAALVAGGMALVALGPIGSWEREIVASSRRASETERVGHPAAVDAAQGLARASVLAPAHVPTARAASRVALAVDDPETAIEISERVTGALPDSSRSWAMRSWVLQYVELRLDEPPYGALDALAKAVELDPWSVVLLSRGADLAERLGEDDLAASYAERAIRADDLLRLDPLKRLPPGDRARLEALADGRANP